MAKEIHHKVPNTGKQPKVNILKPSMREKKRYIAFEIASERPLGFDADKRLISKMNEMLGVFLAPSAGIMRVRYEPKSQRGLLRVERKFVDHVRSCFVMIKMIGDTRVSCRTLRVSGMLNQAAVSLQEKNKGTVKMKERNVDDILGNKEKVSNAETEMIENGR
jgi:ribonuclease P/MRP protein subunit POP5